MTVARFVADPRTRYRVPHAMSCRLLGVSGVRLEPVTRLSLNRPIFVVAEICVNPRNWNVSGFPSPRSARFRAANRPNWTSRGVMRTLVRCENVQRETKRLIR